MKRWGAILCAVVFCTVLQAKADELYASIFLAKYSEARLFWGGGITCVEHRVSDDVLFGHQDYATTYYMKDGKVREGAPGACPVTISDGTTQWTLKNPQAKAMTESAGGYGGEVLMSVKGWYRDLPSTAVFAGEESVDGVLCRKITYVKDDGTRGALFVNRKTGDLVRRREENQYGVSTTTNTGFHKIEGAVVGELPTTQTFEMISNDPSDGPDRATITIQDIQFNQPLSDDLFTPEKVVTEKR